MTESQGKVGVNSDPPNLGFFFRVVFLIGTISDFTFEAPIHTLLSAADLGGVPPLTEPTGGTPPFFKKRDFQDFEKKSIFGNFFLKFLCFFKN